MPHKRINEAGHRIPSSVAIDPRMAQFADDESLVWNSEVRGNSAWIEHYHTGLDEEMFGAEKPFIAHYKQASRNLYFVACEHETKGATFALIGELFSQWPLNWMIIEGFATDRGSSPTEIAQLVLPNDDHQAWEAGEGAFAIRSCLETRIQFEGGEPSDESAQVALSKRGIREKDLANAILVAALVQNCGGGNGCPKCPTDHEIERWHELMKGKYPCVAHDREALSDWWNECFHIGLEEDQNWCARADPGGSGPASAAMRELNLYRDRHLYELIIDRLTEHRSVGVVFGGSHLASLWKPLSAALGEPRMIFP